MKNKHASSSNLTAEQSHLTAEEDTKVDIIEENTDTNVGKVVEPVKTTKHMLPLSRMSRMRSFSVFKELSTQQLIICLQDL